MAGLSLIEKLEQKTYCPLHYLPLITSPALNPKYQNFQVDKLLILARTISCVALSALTITGLYFIYPPAALLITKYEITPIIGTLILTLALSIHEVVRARGAADQLAVENYYTEPFPSKEAMTHIYSSPRAFQLLLNKKEKLDKGDENGERLSTKIFRHYFVSSKVQDMFISNGGDLFRVNANGTSLFMDLIGRPDTTLLDKVLKSERVEIQTSITSLKANSIEVWKKVKHSNTIQLLCQHGFDINAQDDQGITPLMLWAKNGNKNLCIAALNAGATPLLINHDGQYTPELSPNLPDSQHSLLKMILLQAAEEFGLKPLSLPKDKSCLARLPWKPLSTKTKDPFNYFASRVLRTCAIAAYSLLLIQMALTLAANVIAISTADISLNILSGLAITYLFFNLVELWRGYREVKREAVVEYLTTPVPSEEAMNTICQSKETAHMLIKSLPEKSPLLNKLFQKTGETLLGRATPEVFKLLVDHGADILAGFNRNGFLLAAEQKTTDLLQYIAAKDLIPPPNKISEELQINMWLSIQSKETADFLKNHNFNPNVQDKNGNTPLMMLISTHKKNLNQAALLIAAGADTSEIKSRLDPQTFTLLIEAAQRTHKSTEP
jgi:ankyrin repeat protein